MAIEKTFSIIKPDATEKNVVGKILDGILSKQVILFLSFHTFHQRRIQV